jgi:hypothetical protein
MIFLDFYNLYRKQEAELAEMRAKEALSKAKQAEAKLVLRVKVKLLTKNNRCKKHKILRIERI